MSKDALTVQRLTYPPHIQALNGLCWVAEQLGLGLGRLDQQSILDAARRKTGLEDWGSDDFLEPMSVLIEDAKRQPLTAMARVFLRTTFVKAVCNRLRIQAARKANPLDCSRPIHRPVFILGFPRSGTTLLQNLLALEDGRRGLQFWELTTPYPVLADRERDRARRVTIAERFVNVGYLVAPEMGDVHTITATSYEECWPLFTNSFSVLNFDMQTRLPTYGDHLRSTDMTPAYQYYREQLQLLQGTGDDQLLLKCPEHLWFIDALLAVFPDACIVWTHRNPVQSVASYCSLMTLPRRMLLGKVDPAAVGEDLGTKFVTGVERAMAARDRAEAAGRGHQFYDVNFRDLVADPEQVVLDICRHFEFEVSDAFPDRMKAYLAQDRQDERGRHVYSGKMFHLDEEKLAERFSAYTKRFGIS
ncbi:MAG: sulfotransferase family protein [Myxococcota bacterium]